MTKENKITEKLEKAINQAKYDFRIDFDIIEEYPIREQLEEHLKTINMMINGLYSLKDNFEDELIENLPSN